MIYNIGVPGPGHQGEDAVEGTHTSSSFVVMRSANTVSVNEQVDDMFAKINTLSDEFTKKGSGWIYSHTDDFTITFARYRPIKGAKYSPLPAWVANKKACINVKNSDDRCFEYAMASCLFPVAKNSDRANKYDLTKINIPQSVTYPVESKHYPIYEKLNDVSINFFSSVSSPLVNNNKSICCSFGALIFLLI